MGPAVFEVLGEGRTLSAMSETTWYRRLAWALVAGLAGLVMIFGLFVLFSPVDDDDFSTETGIEWSEFSAGTPDVAGYLEREARLLGAIALGFGALVAILAVGPLRRGDVEVWRALWVFPLVLALTAGVFITAGAQSLAGIYLVAAIVAGVALALVPRRASSSLPSSPTVSSATTSR